MEKNMRLIKYIIVLMLLITPAMAGEINGNSSYNVNSSRVYRSNITNGISGVCKSDITQGRRFKASADGRGRIIRHKTIDELCDAIYLAEGGSRTNHPYGIMKKFKKTSPREACKNTIRSAIKRYYASGQKGCFVAYLQKTYAPINCDTDNGTNRYWTRNVLFFLNKKG